jgi:nucleotide-binding universal stress UspA family protein
VDQRQRIVVGVHDSPASLAALGWAAREAHLRGAGLQVVRAWERRAGWASYAPHPGHPGARHEPAVMAARLQEAVRALLGPAPAITVTVEVIEGLAARVLLDRAESADLLVLGGTAGPVSGPVARACLRHAACPVVVVTAKAADVPLPA